MPTEEHFLHRHVHPSWIQEGRSTSQTFNPTPKDAGRLSIYDGAQISVDSSFAHYTTVLKLTAMGTLSVSTGEVEAVDLPWKIDGVPFPEHGIVDFTGIVSPNKAKAKAQALNEKAKERGWTFLP